MKKYIYTIAVVLTASVLAIANTPKNAAQLFEAAEEEFAANKFVSSLELYLKADSAYQAEGLANPDDEGKYLINIATIYLAMQDEASAVKYLEMALPKVEKFSENYEYVLGTLGSVYFENGDNANIRRIMGLMEEHNQHEMTKECNTPECHLEKAKYFMTIGQPANAKDEFNAVFAMPLSEKQKANAYQQYAVFLTSQDDFTQARAYYAMAANAYDQIGEVVTNVSGYQDEPNEYEQLVKAKGINANGDADIADYENAIAIYEKLGMYDEAQQTKDGLNLYLLHSREGSSNHASQLSPEQLHELIRSSKNTLEQGGEYLGKLSYSQTLSNIAGSYAYLEDYSNAVDYYAQYINVIRQVLIEDFLLKNPQERELAWKQELSTIKEMNLLIEEIPEDSLELYFRLSNLIYNGQLLAKGILLSSNIEFDKVLNQYGTPEMNSQFQQIKKNLLEIERMKQEHQPIESILDLTRKTDALQLALSREAASKGVYTDFLKYTSADIVSALNPDEAAIEFVTLDLGAGPEYDMIAAIIISKEYPVGVTMPVCSVSDINAIIADKNKFANDDYTLTVWGGIIQLIQDKSKIYFAPDGVLNNIGIEYLTIEGTPINELIEMSRLSSTREICREHKSQPLQYASLFGNIDYAGDPSPAIDKSKYRKTRETDGMYFSTLEHTGREVSEISSMIKKNVNQSTVFNFASEKASKAEFLSQQELPINLLHIATHGKYIENNGSDSDAMNRSILAFAGANMYDDIDENEGIVTAAEIAQMSLMDCDLVVLSACESGLGQLGNDGVFGLQRGFKNAGVKSLLVSLNEVADRATADMMIAFYHYLLEANHTKQEALKKAQSEIRAKYPRDNTWASFILIDSFD